MNRLKEFIELDKQRKELNEELIPLQTKMAELKHGIDIVNDKLSFTKEKEFISQKLWDAFDSDTKEALQYLREKRAEEINWNAISYSAYKTPFVSVYYNQQDIPYAHGQESSPANLIAYALPKHEIVQNECVIYQYSSL